MIGFVRASRLYNADQGEPVTFDWARGQTLAQVQAEVKEAVDEMLANAGDA
ncbi:hypothetical protein OB920_05315 [Halobacteria archaeon HArc-gm2]|nr:hypothetical protein [Halobacteria archaeon HArc-gm2]